MTENRSPGCSSVSDKEIPFISAADAGMIKNRATTANTADNTAAAFAEMLPSGAAVRAEAPEYACVYFFISGYTSGICKTHFITF
ncbi:MAG TPA: hypothetical protein DDX72_00485 [Ruminococcaceae bacterium]|nr:hypothetical protein [Oscillospiraceae bacterium]